MDYNDNSKLNSSHYSKEKLSIKGYYKKYLLDSWECLIRYLRKYIGDGITPLATYN